MTNHLKKCYYCGEDNPENKVEYTNCGDIICNPCLEKFEANLMLYTVGDYKGTLRLEEKKKVFKPKEIKSLLDKHVIGQEKAKKVLSVAVYNHIKKSRLNQEKGEIFDKSNILLVGPTGCGKTYLIDILGKILNIPIAKADATSLTEAGYIGKDVESVMEDLYKSADGNLAKAEKGIIYIDEIDKISKSMTSNRNHGDVGGENVQQALLRMMEKGNISFSIESGLNKRSITMNTSNILFIFSGSFAGIEDIINKRLSSKSSMGFNAEVLKGEKINPGELSNNIIIEDIINFGMIPEFVGRIPMIVALEELSEDNLVRILIEPDNNIIDQYKKLYKEDGIDLSFTNSSLKEVARISKKRGTGARGLRSILENSLLKSMYEIFSIEGNKIKIKKEDIKFN